MNTLTLIRAANLARQRERHYDRLATAFAHADPGEQWAREIVAALDQQDRYCRIADRAEAKYTAKIQAAGI